MFGKKKKKKDCQRELNAVGMDNAYYMQGQRFKFRQKKNIDINVSNFFNVSNPGEFQGEGPIKSLTGGPRKN